MRVNSYDCIASVYDYFSLALGKRYRESKGSFLDDLVEGDLVLYVGGGTGGNLVEILDRVGDRGKVYYVEASSQMIKKAKARVPLLQESRIVFVKEADFSKLPFKTFDKVITQYFLDILSDQQILKLFKEIGLRTDEGSRWIFADFFEKSGKLWLVKSMILFFRWVTKNPRKDLPDYKSYFDRFGWSVRESRVFDQGFIEVWMLGKEES